MGETQDVGARRCLIGGEGATAAPDEEREVIGKERNAVGPRMAENARRSRESSRTRSSPVTLGRSVRQPVDARAWPPGLAGGGQSRTPRTPRAPLRGAVKIAAGVG